MALLDLVDVSFTVNNLKIIKNVSISIEKGSVTAILGKSGCGKSTILKLLAGLINPTSGKLFFEKNDVSTMTTKLNTAFRKKASFVFQDSALWANQDIYHNLELPLLIHFPKMTQVQRENKIKSYAAYVGYNKPLTNRPASLSMGEQKKISFARALICEPEILFLDECTESLDDKSVEMIISILKDFCYNNKTVIYVSHDPSFIKTFMGNKYIIDNGTVERIGMQEKHEV